MGNSAYMIRVDEGIVLPLEEGEAGGEVLCLKDCDRVGECCDDIHFKQGEKYLLTYMCRGYYEEEFDKLGVVYYRYPIEESDVVGADKCFDIIDVSETMK